MNACYRALVALSAVIPLSIPFVYIFAESLIANIPRSVVDALGTWPFLNLTAVLVFLMAVCNFALGKVIVWCLDCVARKIGSEPIRVEAVKLLGGGSLLGYLPYVLPLFIMQGDMQGALGWLIGAVALYVLSFASMTIPFSPLLSLCGLRFYEASLADKTTVTLLIRGPRMSPLKLKGAAWISDFCVYGLR